MTDDHRFALAEELEARLPILMRRLFPAHLLSPLAHVSLGQLRLLRLLEGSSELSVSKVADQLRMTPSAVTQMSGRLIAMGLVRTDEVPHDARVKLLAVTEEGQRQLRQWKADRARVASEQMDGVANEDIEAFIIALENLLERLPADALADTGEDVDQPLHRPRMAS